MARQPVFDSEYLEKLQDYFAKHPVFPSYAEIGRIVGLNSTSSVSKLLQRLRDEGYIETEGRRFAPTPKFFERPVMASRVAAGLPSQAFDTPAEGLAIDAHLVAKPSKTFLLVVKGESMTGAGLMPGDTLVVERDRRAASGDIVVALVDDAYTVKRLKREGNKYILTPENKAFPVLRPDNLEIAGVVVGSFRKYA
jgi:repressor LexA